MSEYVNRMRDSYRDEVRLKRIAHDMYFLTISDRSEAVTLGVTTVFTRLGICDGEEACGAKVKRFAQDHYANDWQKVISGAQLVADAYCYESGEMDCLHCVLREECPKNSNIFLPEFLRMYDKARF